MNCAPPISVAVGPSGNVTTTVGICDGRVGVGNKTVELPTTMSDALGARLSTCPDTVIAGPPGTSVWLPMTKAEWLFSVIVGPFGRVTTVGDPGLGGCVGRAIVALPTTTALEDGASEMGVPSTVIGAAPGYSV